MEYDFAVHEQSCPQCKTRQFAYGGFVKASGIEVRVTGHCDHCDYRPSPITIERDAPRHPEDIEWDMLHFIYEQWCERCEAS